MITTPISPEQMRTVEDATGNESGRRSGTMLLTALPESAPKMVGKCFGTLMRHSDGKLRWLLTVTMDDPKEPRQTIDGKPGETLGSVADRLMYEATQNRKAAA
jgi:hypothetical protein